MSGIAGFCNPFYNYLEVERKWINILNDMNNSIQHRGSDNVSIFLTKNCGLTNVHLYSKYPKNYEIMDPLIYKSPLTKSYLNKKYTIVFDGQIFNSKQLHQNLINNGVIFKTNLDEELILHGHLLYGENFVNKLNGNFSYAIWNSIENNICLYRDKIGTKPLFYIIENNTIIFASEIKALFKYPNIKPKLGREGLCEIFGLGPAYTYGITPFKNILEVQPGHYLKMSFNKIQQNKYWELKSYEHKDSYSATVFKISELIKDAIKKQMNSDAPICTLLSGGIDSSIVSSICARELKNKNKKLQTFSFDFIGNDQFYEKNDFQPSLDKKWINTMVRYLKTNHQTIYCDSYELAKQLYSAVDARDLPCMADIESSLLYFCSKISSKYKITLTGECADEIFGGYPWFYKKNMLKAETFPWSIDIKQREILLSDETIQILNLKQYVSDRYQNTILEVPKLPNENSTEARIREITYLNLKWFMQTLLNRMDRASMYNGLEARVPFADIRIIEYLWNIPWKMKCHNNVVKGLLRDSAQGLVPDEILMRKKNPYPKIYNPIYETMLKNMILEIINDNNSPIMNFISKTKTIDFVKNSMNNKHTWFGQLMAQPQMLAYIIQINYWLKKYKIEIL